MRKDRFFAVFILGLLFFSGCSRREIRGEPRNLQDLNNRVLGLLVSPVLVEPQDIQAEGGFLPSEVRAFSSSTDLVIALKTKRVDAMLTTVETSRFLISADMKLDIISLTQPGNGLRMILRDTDTALLEELNSGIKALKAEGTLDKLYDRYITNVTADRLAAAPAQLPLIEGTQTILVGINGDLPPYDYISADGKPAGFNVALMGELSRALGKNVQFVTIPSDARFSALLSKNTRRMDLFFWFYGNLSIDSLVLTEAYAEVDECILVRKE
ncbi:MAG: transporter substrate-binding domain-containing protein [Spirochaetaceae bacterium]|jgi:ABC-type amino acid transport substrate-binding protein|nr:transporter substrate-binding domain-containing protein [Spirochaetaceae bacterium]